MILTSYVDEDSLTAAEAAGARAFVLKTLRSSLLVDSIRRVATGVSLLAEARATLHATTAAAPACALPPSTPLSAREQAILTLITEGMTNRQIAARLYVSDKTVANNISLLLAKLGMKRRTQLAAYGARKAGRRPMGRAFSAATP